MQVKLELTNCVTVSGLFSCSCLSSLTLKLLLCPLGAEAWKLNEGVWGSSSQVWIKGTGSESLTDLLALGRFVSKGSLEFCVCNIVTKFLLTLNKGIFFSIFLKNMNQSFLSFSGIFHECKCIKIRLFSALPTFSASLKVQINVVSVLIAEPIWLI